MEVPAGLGGEAQLVTAAAYRCSVAFEEFQEKLGAWQAKDEERRRSVRFQHDLDLQLDTARERVQKLAGESVELLKRARAAESESDRKTSELAKLWGEREQLRAECEALRAENVELAAVEGPLVPEKEDGGASGPAALGASGADAVESETEHTRESLAAELAARGWRLQNAEFDRERVKGMLSPFSAIGGDGGMVLHGGSPERLLRRVDAYEAEHGSDPAPRPRVRVGVVGTEGAGR